MRTKDFRHNLKNGQKLSISNECMLRRIVKTESVRNFPLDIFSEDGIVRGECILFYVGITLFGGFFRGGKLDFPALFENQIEIIKKKSTDKRSNIKTYNKHKLFYI